jgi:hypothetical protein
MSIVSENSDPARYEINMRHRCVACGCSLVGQRIVATADGDACEPCDEQAARLGIPTVHYRHHKPPMGPYRHLPKR